jgi:hypothetical protein
MMFTQNNNLNGGVKRWMSSIVFGALNIVAIIVFVLILKEGMQPLIGNAAPGIYKALNFRGTLRNADNTLVADGSYSLKFVIYDAASGGTCLYSNLGTCGTPTGKTITITNGGFSTLIGDTDNGDNALTLDFASDTYWLGITVGTDAELTPRVRIGAAGYAFNADLLDGLNTSSNGGAGSYVPVTNSTGNLTMTGAPQSAAVSGGVLYLNPASATAGYSLLGVAVGGSERFKVDASGNVAASGTAFFAGTSTSTFGGGFQATALSITSVSTTSTFANGIQLSGGCFRMLDGSCAGVGGANTALSNLASVAINASLTPGTNNTLDLGTFGMAWRDIYASSSLRVGNTSASTTISANGNITSGGLLLSSGNNTLDIGVYNNAWRDIYASGTLYGGTGYTISDVLLTHSGYFSFTGNTSSTLKAGLNILNGRLDVGNGTATSSLSGSGTSTFSSNLATTGMLSVTGNGTSTFNYGALLATVGGNVGIGTSTVPEKLSVDGSISASQGIRNSAGWLNNYTGQTEVSMGMSQGGFGGGANAGRPFATSTAWSAYDASTTDGMNTTGYYGAVFDGKYIYFVPSTNATGLHGKILRYNTTVDFKTASAWSAFDVATVPSNIMNGYSGAVFDGRYIYFIPIFRTTTSPTMLRYDTRADFKTLASWTAYDASATDGMDTVGYQGGVFDGRYVYFVPHTSMNDFATVHGRVLRYDTIGGFTASASWQAYDAGTTDGLDTRGYQGGVFDGRYVYFVPYAGTGGTPTTHGRVLRYDTLSSFKDTAAWAAYDAGAVDGNDTKEWWGATFDGRFIYFSPVAYGAAVRFDTVSDFKSAKSWKSYGITVAGNTNSRGLDTGGYTGAVFDGRYVYYSPFLNSIEKHGITLRYDTTGNYSSSTAWSAYDAGNTDGITSKGFAGAIFDGRYVYYVPISNTAGSHGTVLRYDTGSPTQEYGIGRVARSSNFFIDTSGNVSIGTVAPTSTLTLGGVPNYKPWLTLGNGTASTTITSVATSTFAAGLQTTLLNVTSNSATSTFANGIQLLGGCFRMLDGTCAGAGSGGANTALSNLASVAINASLTPGTNNTLDLGAFGTAWKDVYASGTVYGSIATSTWYASIATSTFYGSITTSTFDGVNIGASTAGTGRFTTLTSMGSFTPTGGISTTTIDGIAVGASTASTGRFTTLTSTGIFTPTGGISTSTLDDVVVGGSTAAAGNFTTLVGSTSGRFGNGAATGTLSVIGTAPWLTLGNGTASTTITSVATSTFAAGLQTTLLNITSNSATSTFANGIQLLGGCFRMLDGTCAGAGSGGANTALSNLASVAINASLTPGTNNTLDLGIFGMAWRDIYASSSLRVGNTSASTTISANGNITSGGLLLPSGNNTLDIGAYNNAWKDIYASGTIYGGTGSYTISDVSLTHSGYFSFTGNTSSTLKAGLNILNGRLDVGNGSATTSLSHTGTSTFASNLATTGMLSVTGNGTSTFNYGATFAATGGNMGIGTATPIKKLDIRGDAVLYQAGSSFSEGFNTFWPGTGNNQSGGGINLHIGSDGAAPSASTLKGYVRTLQNGNLMLGTYNGSTDNIAMVLQNSNGNVGIHTVSPSSTLEVLGSFTVSNGSSTTTIYGNTTSTFAQGLNIAVNGGNVGIGTATPTQKLDINSGNLRVLGPNAYDTAGQQARIYLGNMTDANNGIVGIMAQHSYGMKFGVFQSGGNGSFGSNSMDAMAIRETTGNVGIHTVSPSSTLEVLGSFTVSNGSSTTTIYGNTTSTFAQGLNIAVNGGNVGIGTSTPTQKLDLASGNLRILGSNGYDASGEQAILYLGNMNNAANGAVGIMAQHSYGMKFGVFQTNGNGSFGTNSMDAMAIQETTGNVGIGTIYPADKLTVVGGNILRGNGSATTTITVGNRGSATSTFYSDLWVPNRDVSIGGVANAGNLWVGDGTATTTIRGGLSGSATTTFAGDVVMSNIYGGSIEFDEDAGIVGAMNIPITSAATGTTEGYSFDVDGLSTLFVGGTSDGLASVWNRRVGVNTVSPSSTLEVLGNFAVGNNSSTATIYGETTSTFSQGLNMATNGGNVGIGNSSPVAKLDILGATTQFHFGSSADVGGYLTSVTNQQADISGGASWNGANWIAKSTLSSQINMDSGVIVFDTNSGLTAGNSFTPTERMRLDTSGRLGIGTTAPSSTLEVLGNFAVGNGSATATIYGNTTSTFSQGLNIAVNGGNVGVGTSTPNYKFQVDATAANTGVLRVQNDSSSGCSAADFFNNSSALMVGLGYCNANSNFTALNNGAYINTATGVDFIIANGVQPQVTFKSTGLVGIGTTAPSSTLEVYKTTGGLAEFGNGTATTSIYSNNITIANGTICVDNDGSCNPVTVTAGTIYADNFDSTTAKDLAERFETSDLTVEAGDVVAIDSATSEYIAKTTSTYDRNILGVVSTKAGFTLGNVTDKARPVALAGRVPVKVTNENGAIRIGDYLTSASRAGYAMKATSAGATLGRAMENSDSTEGKIIAFINVGYFDGVKVLSGGAQLTVGGDVSGIGPIVSADGIDMASKPIINVASISGVNQKWSIGENGDIAFSGELVKKVETAAGTKDLYPAYNSDPTIMLSGSGQLFNGEARIVFDAALTEMIDASSAVKVSVALTADSANGIYIAEKSVGNILIKATNGGTGDATFDYIIVARRNFSGTYAAPMSWQEATSTAESAPVVASPVVTVPPQDSVATSTDVIVPTQDIATSTDVAVPPADMIAPQDEADSGTVGSI